MLFPGLPCIGKSGIYNSCSGVIIKLQLKYIWFFICMLVHHITVSSLMYLCILYNIVVWCTSSWLFPPISLLCVVHSTTASLFHLNLYSFLCEYYTYVYCNIFVYFIRSTPRFYSILIIVSYIFPVNDLLLHFSYPRWPTFTKVD